MLGGSMDHFRKRAYCLLYSIVNIQRVVDIFNLIPFAVSTVTVNYLFCVMSVHCC